MLVNKAAQYFMVFLFQCALANIKQINDTLIHQMVIENFVFDAVLSV